MKFSFFILICLALLATMLPATVFGKPLLNSAAGKGFGAFGASTAGNADNAPDRFRRNVDNIQLVTAAGSAAANFNSLNRFAGTVDAEFSRAARSQTLNRWQVIFRKVKNNNNNNNQAVQPKLDSELEGYQTTAQAVTEDVLGEELRNAAAAAVTSALAFRSSSTEVPSEEEAMVDAAKKSTEEAKKASLVKAIRIMKAQKISPDIIYSIVQNYQDDPDRLMAILTSNKI